MYQKKNLEPAIIECCMHTYSFKFKLNSYKQKQKETAVINRNKQTNKKK